MEIGRICSRVVEVARPDESVADAARRMLEQNVGSLVVQGEDGRVVGILTDRDLMLDVLAQDRDGNATRVEEVMAGRVQTIREEASIEDALAMMRDREVRRLPVIDAENALVGLVTLDDLLAWLSEQLGAIGKLLEAESPRKLLDHALPASPRLELAPRIRPGAEGGEARDPANPGPSQ